MRPDGVHLPGGMASALVVVDEAADFDPPCCSVCGQPIHETFYRCLPCEATMCRRCVAADTTVVECDCPAEIHVSGVLSAARRAAAAQTGVLPGLR